MKNKYFKFWLLIIGIPLLLLFFPSFSGEEAVTSLIIVVLFLIFPTAFVCSMFHKWYREVRPARTGTDSTLLKLKSTIQKHTKTKHVLIFFLFINACIAYYLVKGDLAGEFVSIGVIAIIVLYPIQFLVSLMLWGFGYQILKDRNCPNPKPQHKILYSFLIAWTVIVFFAPPFLVEKLAPLYDAKQLEIAQKNLQIAIANYKEPTYLPPDVPILDKYVELYPFSAAYIANIDTYYKCKDPNTENYGIIRISVSAPLRDDKVRNAVIVNINGKEAFYLNGALVMYDDVVRRSVSINNRCKSVNYEEDLIKIMESLQSVQYEGPQTVGVRSPYRSFID